MSSVRNKQMSELFGSVRNQLELGGFICNIIMHNLPYSSATGAALGLITSRLNNGVDTYDTLEGWLVRNRIATNDQIAENPQKVYNTRLAWLDSLIAEFDKPGYYKG